MATLHTKSHDVSEAEMQEPYGTPSGHNLVAGISAKSGYRLSTIGKTVAISDSAEAIMRLRRKTIGRLSMRSQGAEL